MTIESAPAASPAPAKASPTANSGKAKPGSTDASAAGTLGFLALLTAADDAMTPTVDGGALVDTASQDANDSQQRDADASALAGWLLGTSPSSSLDMAKADEVVVAAPLNKATGAVRAVSAATDIDIGGPKHLGGASLVGQKTGQLLGTAALQQSAEKPMDSAGVSVVPQAHEEASRKLQDSQIVRVPEGAQSLASSAKEAVMAVGSVAVGERRVAEPVVGKPVAADPTYFQTQAASAPMGMDGVVGNQSANPLESYVAEQVTYWISQDVQKAELTMDDLGFSPVQVSISMQGNEAQVAFRTDEVQARLAIEGASQQLRESLERQGLMLTGMSVGTSDGGDASGQGRRPRQEGRQAVVTALAPVTSEQVVRPIIPQGRALDLFV